MDIDHFWKIIAEARDAAVDVDSRVDSLGRVLKAERLDELQSFQNHYDEQIRRSYRWDLWGAAYLMNGGCSDDGFRYFRDWLVSEGRETFEGALASADSLATLARVELAELESFGYVALGLFAKKGGGEISRAFSIELSTPAGEEWSEDDLPRLLPKLAAIYG